MQVTRKPHPRPILTLRDFDRASSIAQDLVRSRQHRISAEDVFMLLVAKSQDGVFLRPPDDEFETIHTRINADKGNGPVIVLPGSDIATPLREAEGCR